MARATGYKKPDSILSVAEVSINNESARIKKGPLHDDKKATNLFVKLSVLVVAKIAV
jgi:hypothetical protein